MKLIKKSLSFITAIAYCAAISSIMPVSSSAEESVKTYGDLSYFTSDSDGDGTDDYVKIIDCNESVSEVEIPAEIEGLPVKKIETSTFYDRPNLTDINVAENNNYYSSSAGLLFNKDKTVFVRYPAGKLLKEFNIPDGVNSIDTYAFKDCKNLTKITIPNSVTFIDDKAFYCCSSLVNITIPDSVNSIGNMTFFGCAIKNINIPNSVTIIKRGAFWSCPSLTSINIPESVTSIDSIVLNECNNLKCVIINNPDCEIFDTESTISETATIYGYENSTAQAYAERYCRRFVSIEDIGDISGNGEIDLYDAIEIAKAIMGLRTFTAEEMIIADFNMDGAVDLYDAIEIARTLLPK